MEWLANLLGVETPEGTTLRSAELGFRGSFAWGLALLLVLAAAAGVLLLYLREGPRVGLARKLLMALLRTSLIALLIVLLFRPVLLAEFEGHRPQAVVLLLDDSQSMKQADKRLSAADRLRVAIANGLVPADTPLSESATLATVPQETPKDPSRAELVRAVLTDAKRDLLGGLLRHGPLRPYLFGAELHGVRGEAEKKSETARPAEQVLADYKAEEVRTALADAVNEVLQRKDGDLPAAVVIASDGQDNASKFTLKEVATACGRLKVPLHIYGVGSTEGGSLQIKDLALPETIFYDDAVSVPLRWRARGFKKGTVQIRLTLGGKVVAEKDVPVRSGEDLRDVLSFTPHKDRESEEKLELVASVTLKENEAFKDTLKRPVRLSDSKVKVLYVENSPRWEFKFLQPALLRDRRVEANFLLVNADRKVLEGGPPFLPSFPSRDKLLTYDLIILGDVPAGYLGTEHLTWIKEFVKDFRGGLIMIAGRQNAPSSYDNTPLAEVLPVEFQPHKGKSDVDARPQAYVPALTTAGQSAGMLALADVPEENLKVWEGLPGFYWFYPVTKLRPAATAYLTHPRAKMGEQPMPLMASQFYGKGQVLFLGTDETWRWRWNTEDKHFARFWGQVIYQMALPHLLGDSSRRVQVALERSEAVLGRPGSLYARLLDQDFHPLKDKEVHAVLEHLDAKPGQERTRKVTLHAVPGREGEYRVLLENDSPGHFELKLPGTDEPFQYRVQLPPRHELEEAGMAEDALREAARLSGGAFYREEDLYRLPSQVEPQKATFTLHQEVLLWNPLVWLLFVGLVTAEWVLRKFSNLS